MAEASAGHPARRRSSPNRSAYRSRSRRRGAPRARSRRRPAPPSCAWLCTGPHSCLTRTSSSREARRCELRLRCRRESAASRDDLHGEPAATALSNAARSPRRPAPRMLLDEDAAVRPQDASRARASRRGRGRRRRHEDVAAPRRGRTERSSSVSAFAPAAEPELDRRVAARRQPGRSRPTSEAVASARSAPSGSPDPAGADVAPPPSRLGSALASTEAVTRLSRRPGRLRDSRRAPRGRAARRAAYSA